MPAETQLRIASQLLGHLLSQQPNRTIPGSMLDIRYSLDVAAELMRQQSGRDGAPPTYDYDPPSQRKSLGPEKRLSFARW